jgi:hypothetical protein
LILQCFTKWYLHPSSTSHIITLLVWPSWVTLGKCCAMAWMRVSFAATACGNWWEIGPRTTWETFLCRNAASRFLSKTSRVYKLPCNQNK